MSSHRLDRQLADLLNAAIGVQEAAAEAGSSEAAADALASLETALQVLSAGWYQIAADAVPAVAGRGGRLGDLCGPSQAVARRPSREQEVRLVGTLHDVAGAFARCARTCREAQPTVAPLIGRRVTAAGGAPRFSGPGGPALPKGRLA
jgi:hypothetical protein